MTDPRHDDAPDDIDTEVAKPDDVDLDDGTEADGTPVENPSG
ncbi:hypothetical protein [Herbiconiux liangxiaofengii]